MCLADAVGQRGGGVPVGVLRLVVLVGLFAGGAGIFAFAAPVVFPGGGIDILCQVVVVVGGEQEVESAGEEVALGVFHRGYEGVAFAVFLPEDDVLVDAGLDFFIEVAVCEVQHQAVGPGFVHQAYFGDDGFVVEAVVEAAQAVDAAAVGGFEAVGGKFGDVVVDVVVVVRQVLEGVKLVGEAVAEGLAEVDVGLVGVEGAVGVGGVEEPAASLFVGDDVDDAAQGVGAEAYGYDAFVDFDAFGVVDGQVVEVQCLSGSFLG